MTSNTTKLCRSLAFVSALALAGGVAMAEKRDKGPHDGDRPRHHQGDQDGEHRGDRDGRHHRAGQGEDRGHRGPDHREMHRRLFAGLELTDEQKEQVKQTLQKHGETRKAWHEAHKDEMHDLRQQMKDARDAEDKEAAVKAVREKMKALRDSAPKPGDVHDELRAILNEQQRADFDERVAKFKENKEKWQKRREEGGPEGKWRRDRGPDGERQRDGRRPEGRRGHAGRLFGNLDLTDEQRDTIRDTMQGDGDRKEKMAAVRDLLTDEQQAKLDENLEKMRAYREKHKGERGERGDHRRHRDGEGRQRDRRQNDDDDNKDDDG